MFRAVLIEQGEGGQQASLVALDESRLPEGEVLVAIDRSTLNYKDALAITGRGPVVRRFPMIPGIDFAGRVLDSRHERFRPGDPVLLNGWGVGELHWGGLAERARVQADWLLAMPDSLDASTAMALGTAGYTAMLAVQAIERHGSGQAGAEAGEVLVTGAGGGVGGISITLLARLGYRVVAATGRPQEADYLRGLGAVEVIDRATLAGPGRPLARERWAAAIDSLGGHTLANICASCRYGAVVAACGLAESMELPATVAPFILRGITLAGIDSVYRPRAEREHAWQRLSELIDRAQLAAMTRHIGLDEAIGAAEELLQGRVRGRLVVDTAG